LTIEEAKIVSLLRDLLFEADPDADTREPMSALLLTVWADQFDGVNVWGSIHPFVFDLILVTPSLAKMFRAVADAIKADAASRMGIDDPMDGINTMNGLSAF
jgi:hypothetical protein